MLEIEEGNRTTLEFRADDALRRQTESIAIKPQRAFSIIDTKRNDSDPRLHRRTSAPIWGIETGDGSEMEVSMG